MLRSARAFARGCPWLTSTTHNPVFWRRSQAAVIGGLNCLLSAATGASDAHPFETAGGASFIARQTLALEIPSAFARSLRLIPRSQSRSRAGRSTGSGARPIWRPSSLARRIPARSTVRGCGGGCCCSGRRRTSFRNWLCAWASPPARAESISGSFRPAFLPG